MDRSEIRWVALFLALGAVGLAFFLHFYDEAFPAASLNFELSREEAFQKAQGYVEELGYSTEAYESAQIFSWRQMQQIFLERTIGLEETNRLAREWVSIWAWSVRWYRPLQKEELRVQLDPGGRIVSFSHKILESDEGANLAQDAALPISEQFLREVQGFDLGGYDLIERSSVERKARTDHTFTYRKQDFTVGEDGHYRLEVVVQGDRVGRFSEYLKVPETFDRNYKETRSRAGLLSMVASVFWLVLAVAMVVVLIQKFRERLLQWRTGLIVGATVSVAFLIGQLNALPLAHYDYVTTESYSAFILNNLIINIIGAVFLGGLICLVGTAGDAAGREALLGGRRSPLGRLSLSRIFSGSFAQSTLVGYGLAFSHLGYVTLFYILGARYLGVWTPAEMPDYNNTFSTAFPWIYPLLVGLVAATMEEFFFRLLAISLLIKYLKRRWLAVLIPAMVWAFLHSEYPVEPIYTRGLELTVVGVVFGIVFLRYGIWATIISHYAYNAFLGAFPMVKSSSLYFQVSGIAVIGVLFLPAVPALFGVITGRYRRVEEEVEEEGEEGEEAPEPVAEAFPSEAPPPEAPEPEGAPVPEEAIAQKGPEDYLPGKREWAVAGICALLGAAVLIGMPVKRFGERTLSLSVARPDAVKIATAFCREIGVDTEGYRRTVWFSNNLRSDHYVHLVREAGVPRADTLAAQESVPWMWTVRWFKFKEKEEIRVGVDREGRIALFEHTLPEARAGAELEAEAARVLAEGFVARHFGRTVTDTVRYKLLEAEAEKREARMDHRFVWERVDRKVEDGEFRLTTRVQGDRVGYVHLSYRAPEVFLRELGKREVKDVVVQVVPGLIVLGTVILGAIFFFRAIRDGQIRWGFPVGFGILTVAAGLVSIVNSYPAFFRRYEDTTWGMGTFLGMAGIGMLIVLCIMGLIATVTVALITALYCQLYPEEMSPSRWFGLFRMREGSARFWGYSLLLGAALLLVLHASSQLSLFARYRWLVDFRPGSFGPTSLNDFLPFLSALADFPRKILDYFTLLAGFLIWRRALNRTWAILLLFCLFRALQPAAGSAENLQDFAVLAGVFLVGFGAQALLVMRAVHLNLLAYLAFAWCSPMLSRGMRMFSYTEGVPFYETNGAVLLLLGLVPLLLPLIAFLKGRHAPLHSGER